MIHIIEIQKGAILLHVSIAALTSILQIQKGAMMSGL
jgi:hypothetical protein